MSVVARFASDFSPLDQSPELVAQRQLNAARREAARSREAAGLVSFKTSHTASAFPYASKAPVVVSSPQCWTGIPQKHEYCSLVPVKFWPSNPSAFEIDQHQMRLRRLKKNVLTSARYHVKEAVGSRSKPLMVTLTYRPDSDWDAKQISSYITSVRNWFKRRCPGQPLRYVWVYELTKAGRPHYHVLFWLPRGITMPKADKRGWWRQGMTRTEWARHAVGYIAKYASKGTDDEIPKGVRLYGVGGLSERSRIFRAWWNLPVTVRRWGFPFDLWRRCPGGGWISRRSGEWRDSLYSVQIILGRPWVSLKPQAIASPLDQLLQALSFSSWHTLF